MEKAMEEYGLELKIALPPMTAPRHHERFANYEVRASGHAVEATRKENGQTLVKSTPAPAPSNNSTSVKRERSPSVIDLTGNDDNDELPHQTRKR
jgi:hypothetical protein